MKLIRKVRILSYIAFLCIFVLIAAGTYLMVNTFSEYNQLSLERQDVKLTEMVHATDVSIDWQLNNIGRDLEYVVKRRGFMQAEENWRESGAVEGLLYRMEESLINSNPIVTSMLALDENGIVLSTNGNTNYRFPSGREETMVPCVSENGKMYLALMINTKNLQYAALIDLETWYGLLSYACSKGTSLMLLGGNERMLLHTWQDVVRTDDVETLKEENCDLQAVQLMVAGSMAEDVHMVSYSIKYSGDNTAHDMRMAVIPLPRSTNGYFTVGLISDYDEIIRPMHSAVIYLLLFGGMVLLGVVLLIMLSLRMIVQKRRTDRELLQLNQKNEEMQKLLEKTRELAHHQRLETIGTMTSGIAHEFNNLLTPIMGYSILTLEGLPESCGDLSDNVAEIYEASRKAKVMVTRLNALARKNAEESEVLLSLNELTEKMLNVAAPSEPAHVKSIMLPCREECLVSGNEMQLSQMLLNLYLNAYHAMEKDGGTLTVSVKKEADQVVLCVRDTGVGIADDALPHIFDAFFTTKEAGKGTGLGLAIVRQVADNHRIRIEVDSEPGKGTAFTMYFPCAENHENNELT
ncbi:MAG: hypothetical protein IKT57_03105 [Clostridia bacterium]|nr:hypothetical protein [Clostridia bacterium]